MNQLLRTAFWAMCLSLGLVLMASMIVVAEGISPESRLAFSDRPRPAKPGAAPAAPVMIAAAPRPAPVVRSNSPRTEPRRPVTPRPTVRSAPLPEDEPVAMAEITPRKSRPGKSSVPSTTVAAVTAPRRERPVEHPPALSFEDEPVAAAEPTVRLNQAVEPEPETPPAPRRHEVIFDVVGTPSSPPPDPRERVLEARLIGIQRQLDALAAAPEDRRMAQLAESVQMLQQAQTQSQLQQLQEQIQQLRNAPPASGTAAITVAQAPASSVPPAPAPENGPPRPETAGSPVLRSSPAEDGSDRFDLQIKDAEITQVLDLLAMEAGINILPSRTVTGKVSANLHDVTVDEALQALLKSGGYVFEREGNFVFVVTAEEARLRQQSERRLVTKVFRPHHISARELEKIIAPLITIPIGKLAVTEPNELGIASDNSAAGGDRLAQQDALLVQDYPEVMADIERIVVEMDQAPEQVVIEAMILSVKLTDSMAFGVNFALLNNQNNQVFVSGNGALIDNTVGFPDGTADQIIPGATQFAADMAGLKYGFLRGDVSAFINALETLADTNLIATPQLMVVNKQKAQLIIGQRLSYSTSTFQNNQSIQNVQFIDAGTKLILRPFISPDGMVRMEVHPERSTATINADTGLPDLTTTEVTTNVMVRDGTTVVIGGLIEEAVTDNQQRIPFLGAMPVVGNLFRNKSERTERTELIVLITPRIVKELPATLEGEAAMWENERRADNFRNTLLPINRRNLTRMYYDKAEEHFQRKELDKAKKFVTEAVRQNPNDRRALRLRDQIDESLRVRRSQWFRFPGSPRPIPEPVAGPELILPDEGY